MVQAERDESAIERVGLERQLVRLTRALNIRRDRLFVLMADVEHRQGLIDANDLAAGEASG